MKYYKKLVADNYLVCWQRENWTIDEENRLQLRKGHHHRHYTRQKTQRKTTMFLD